MQFLAMKLSAVNPTLGVNLESLVAKDVSNHPRFFHPSCFQALFNPVDMDES
jgi:hypothetical protein